MHFSTQNSSGDLFDAGVGKSKNFKNDSPAANRNYFMTDAKPRACKKRAKSEVIQANKYGHSLSNDFIDRVVAKVQEMATAKGVAVKGLQRLSFLFETDNMTATAYEAFHKPFFPAGQDSYQMLERDKHFFLTRYNSGDKCVEFYNSLFPPGSQPSKEDLTACSKLYGNQFRNGEIKMGPPNDYQQQNDGWSCGFRCLGCLFGIYGNIDLEEIDFNATVLRRIFDLSVLLLSNDESLSWESISEFNFVRRKKSSKTSATSSKVSSLDDVDVFVTSANKKNGTRNTEAQIFMKNLRDLHAENTMNGNPFDEKVQHELKGEKVIRYDHNCKMKSEKVVSLIILKQVPKNELELLVKTIRKENKDRQVMFRGIRILGSNEDYAVKLLKEDSGEESEADSGDEQGPTPKKYKLKARGLRLGKPKFESLGVPNMNENDIRAVADLTTIRQTKQHDEPSPGVWYYPSCLKQKPLALLIVNVNFLANSDCENRDGAMVDANRLKKFLDMYSYDCGELHIDLTAAAMEREIMKFLRRENHGQRAILSISSHGCNDAVYGTDGKEVSTRAIITAFNNSQNLKDKPKILFFNSCRVYPTFIIKDPKVEAYTGENLFDIFCVYSTTPGRISWRDTKTGCDFMTLLLDELQVNGWKLPFSQIIANVTRTMRYLKNTSGKEKKEYVQCPEMRGTPAGELFLPCIVKEEPKQNKQK